VIDVHCFNTAADIFDHIRGQLVESMFTIHLEHAQVTVNLTIHIQDVLAIYGAGFLFVNYHLVCCYATAQMSSSEGVGMDLALLWD
jgi:hypothetical protein